MRTLALLVAAATLLLAGCGTDPGTTAADPVRRDRPPPPSQVPAAPGEVATREVVTVLQEARPEVCLGAVAESWPPQCSGPPLLDWHWDQRQAGLDRPGGPVTPGGADAYEQAGPVRWGQYVLTGTWDGAALTVRTAIPAALHDAPSAEPADPLVTSGTDSDGSPRLAGIAREVGAQLPGVLASYVAGSHVAVDVVYDDGSLQDWADTAYGEGVVVLAPALVDVAAD